MLPTTQGGVLTPPSPWQQRGPMTPENTSLPEYESPPVSEVAVALQFDPLEDLKATHLGLLWQEFREAFPEIEEHSPRDSTVESFGVPTDIGGTPNVQVINKPPVPRVWFLTEDGAELIQVQQDRFVFNWRRRDPSGAYPRYKHVRARFRTNLTLFLDFLAREQLGKAVFNQCELTYINLIKPGEGWKTHGQMGNVIPMVQSRYSDGFLAEPEAINFNVRYQIPRDDEPIGRLHIEGQSAYLKEGLTPVIRLRLTARGAPTEPSVLGGFEFLDVGHEWIVRGFTSVTSETMHRIWGRKDA